MKNKKWILILGMVILTLLIVYIISNKKTDLNDTDYQKIFAITLEDKRKKSYLGYRDGYYYYIDGYHLADLYVLQSEELGVINSTIINEAKKKVKENKSVFIFNQKKYYIENLYDAIYMQNNSVSLFLDEIERLSDNIIKIKPNLSINNITIEKKEKELEFKKILQSSNGGSIYIKDIAIRVFIDNKEITELSDLNNCEPELIIEAIAKKYESNFEDYPLSEEIISTASYEYSKAEYLVIEKKRNNNVVDYYIYLENKKVFEEKFGI